MTLPHQTNCISEERRYTCSMSAVLEFNGVRITVPLEDLGAAVLELRRVGMISEEIFDRSIEPSVLKDSVAPKNTVQAALDLRGQDSPEVRFAGRVPRKASDIKAARNFLVMVSRDDLFKGRAETPAALEVFEVKHSKGLGSKLAAVNRLLDSAGFATPDVYTTERDAHGSYWRAGTRIDEAITALAEMALQTELSERPDHELGGQATVFMEQQNKEEQVQPQHNEKSP
ncbi:hypothetical protein DETS111669_29695 [Delftia tsuruhatensis]